jgi:hypothetical protein
MPQDDAGDTADPRRHRQTTAPIKIEDAERAPPLKNKWRRFFGRRTKASATEGAAVRQDRPLPDDLPEIPE